MTSTKRKRKPRPPWCGGCDERTRLAGDPPYRCPVCLAAGPVAVAYRSAHQEEPDA